MEVSLSNWKNLFVAKDTSFFSSCQMNFDGLVGADLSAPTLPAPSWLITYKQFIHPC